MKRIIAAMLVLTALLALGGCKEKELLPTEEIHDTAPVTHTEAAGN